jgi:hypothetical protein
VSGGRGAWVAAEAATLFCYEGENGTIYYGQVPLADDLEPLPVHAVLMKPTPMPEVIDAVPISLHRPGDEVPDVASPADAPPPAYGSDQNASPGAAPPGYAEAAAAEGDASGGAKQRLEDMGFSSIAVTSALSFNGGNEAAALETLLKAA